MLLTDMVAVSLLFLYFWYMTRFNVEAVPQPTVPRGPRLQPFVNWTLSKNNHKITLHTSFAFWETDLPDNYTVTNNQIMEKDECFGLPDGTQVPATGPSLYRYLQQDRLESSHSLLQRFEPNAITSIQDKRVYYFTCHQNHLDALHMCPIGNIFQTNSCQVIDACIGQPDFVRLKDPYDSKRYFQCIGEKAMVHQCGADEIFVNDQCRDQDLYDFCKHGDGTYVLDHAMAIVCDGGNMKYEVCPPGFRYFDDIPKCELSACVGKLNGTRVPMPVTDEMALQYSPGYMICQDNRVVSQAWCSSSWDHLQGDRLPFLPQVFDGQQCTSPKLCTNVTPLDTDIVVPVHEFTKHVGNWNFSERFDQVTGYQCEGTKRKRMSMYPGERISKRLKRESACDNATRVAVSDTPDAYYDCTTRMAVFCPKHHFFDGRECKKRDATAFQYNGIDMFKMDSLTVDNWIKPFDYYQKSTLPMTKCRDDLVLNAIYNVCSHPDCVMYPFLSQTQNFKIGLKDGSECIYNASTKEIDKHPTPRHYLFWSQRLVDDSSLTETCTPGQHTQTGNFVFDSTMYATCNEAQPFVFCPSSKTDKISFFGQRWYCSPGNLSVEIPSNSSRYYTTHQVLKITSLSDTKVKIGGKEVIVPAGSDGLDMTQLKHIALDTLNDPVTVHFQYMNTYPPEMKISHDEVYHYAANKAFLIKRIGSTHKPINIQTYKVEAKVPEFLT